MYTPNLFPNDIFSLWGKEGSNNHSKLYELDRKNGGGHEEEHLEDQRKHLRSLFAPPLVAYSAEYPGASVSQLEYTIKTQTTGVLNAPLLTPLAQRKLERARRIRNSGYTTIVPIGVEKTMEQIDYDESRRYALNEQEDQSYPPTAENSTANDSMNPNISETAPQEEVNLDDEIINSDEYHQMSDDFGDNEDDSEAIANTRYEAASDDETLAGFGDDVLNADDGFMADDVEYQDDHSLIHDAGPTILLNSGSTTTTTTMSSATVNSARSIQTATTSPLGGFEYSGGTHQRITSIRECDEENDENDENNDSHNGNSDLDMVIDE